MLELELKRTDLLTKFAPSYRLVQEVDQQIAETKNTIAQEELNPLRDQSTDLDPNHAWAKSELVKSQVELSALQARAAAGKPSWPAIRRKPELWAIAPFSRTNCSAT